MPENFLTELKTVAGSPLAFVAYLAVLAAWVFAVHHGSKLARLGTFLKEIPEADRSSLIARELSITPRAGLTAEQWLAYQTRKHLLIAFLATVVALVAIAVVALTKASGIPAPTDPANPVRQSASAALHDLSKVRFLGSADYARRNQQALQLLQIIGNVERDLRDDRVGITGEAPSKSPEYRARLTARRDAAYASIVEEDSEVIDDWRAAVKAIETTQAEVATILKTGGFGERGTELTRQMAQIETMRLRYVAAIAAANGKFTSENLTALDEDRNCDAIASRLMMEAIPSLEKLRDTWEGILKECDSPGSASNGASQPEAVLASESP